MHHRITAIILCFLSLFMGGCSPTGSPQPKDLFQFPFEASVEVEANGYQTRGLFRVEENGEVVFLHQNSSSPLFGMKEQMKDGQYSTEFFGIVWSGSHTKTAMKSLLLLPSFSKQYQSITGYADTYEGNNAICYIYQAEDLELKLWTDAKGTFPLAAKIQEENQSLFVRFFPKQESDNRNLLANGA